MMWGVALLVLSLVKPQVLSHEIKVSCSEFHDFPPSSATSPSFLEDLNVELVMVGGKYMLNVSWAVNIDASTKYLTGTLIQTDDTSYFCEYIPHLANANITMSKQMWFHYVVRTSDGQALIQVTNLPLSLLESQSSYKYKSIRVPQPVMQSVSLKSTQATTGVAPVETTASPLRIERVSVAFFGGLTGLIILSSCFLIYKNYGVNTATSLGFKSVPQSPMAPVPVLLVYPAEDSAFQHAVEALAEFLQGHGGCRVAVDMWQQGKIAELGPMRWLAEQAKAAAKVLIVCPQPSSQSSYCPPKPGFLVPSIPAAACDLYLLALNMVASHAKSARNLAKFWVVQLGKQQDKWSTNLAMELRVCRSFCLMKDLNKLCRSLHTHREGNKKICDLILRPGVSYSQQATAKLREAIEKHYKRGVTNENCGLNISNNNVCIDIENG